MLVDMSRGGWIRMLRCTPGCSSVVSRVSARKRCSAIVCALWVVRSPEKMSEMVESATTAVVPLPRERAALGVNDTP